MYVCHVIFQKMYVGKDNKVYISYFRETLTIYLLKIVLTFVSRTTDIPILFLKHTDKLFS